MYIKDRTFKIMNIAYIILSSLLGIGIIYGIINTMVSLKYETEKELLDYHSNMASDYLRQLLDVMYVFGIYLIINVVYVSIMGKVKIKNVRKIGDGSPKNDQGTAFYAKFQTLIDI